MLFVKHSVFKSFTFAAGLTLLSAGSSAFQEQQGAATPEAPAAAAETPAAKPVDLAPADIKTSIGTEVRIPGLGKLGNLPKMDFGLELLYGAADQKQPDSQPREDTRDDLTIRGSVKHKF